MGVIVTGMDMPKSCLECRKRKVLHIDGKAYQLCGLNEDGYLAESWFKAEDLTKTFKAPQCPLISVEGLIEKIREEIVPRTDSEYDDSDKWSNYGLRIAIKTIKEYCGLEESNE